MWVHYPEDWLAVQTEYTSTGFVERVSGYKDGEGTPSIEWQALERHATGQIRVEAYGSGVESTYELDPEMQTLDTVCAGTGDCSVQDLDYDFDAVGNLTQRADANLIRPGGGGALVESIAYDDLNRLRSVTGPGLTPLVVDYSPIGNISSKYRP